MVSEIKPTSIGMVTPVNATGDGWLASTVPGELKERWPMAVLTGGTQPGP